MDDRAKASPEDGVVELADRLHSAAIQVLRMVRMEDAELGLTAPRLSALSVLVFRGPLSVGELAHAEQVTPATVSRLVSDLEALGLVRRTVDPHDARVRRVAPTERGTALLHEGRRRRVRRLADEVDRLPARERVVLGDAVEVLERMLSSSSGRQRTVSGSGSAPPADAS